MKKLVFTALAVVAFCGVSMANTLEVGVEVKGATILENKIKVFYGGDEVRACELAAIDLYVKSLKVQDKEEDINLLNELIAKCH
ncbi:hypothetical protein QWY99_17765 [Flavobacterium branchiarum]|uniref:Uncharacterized protein n=1 Tax=Flavobacterium branchiarum TaxID=1114870 RepID=A0ABV5FL96_9FLAO|nr:hypothetical protein [Flavobacterium branchiarum]MDN3674889.1 hypothetical protein [Flavobacterium branchiarum]